MNKLLILYSLFALFRPWATTLLNRPPAEEEGREKGKNRKKVKAIHLRRQRTGAVTNGTERKPITY